MPVRVSRWGSSELARGWTKRVMRAVTRDGPLVDGGVSLVLDEGYGGEDGVAGGGFDQTKESLGGLQVLSLHRSCKF